MVLHLLRFVILIFSLSSILYLLSEKTQDRRQVRCREFWCLLPTAFRILLDRYNTITMLMHRDTKLHAGGKEKFETLARVRTGPATRVEHLSDTLGPVVLLFSHRFRLGKHGFNRCFTRSVPGTGSSIWDARLVASELWARRAQEERRWNGV